MNPEIQVKFCITGIHVTSDEIIHVLGISPTETWVMGDVIHKTKLKRKQNGWCLSAPKAEGIDLDEFILSLLQVLLPKSELINQLCDKYGLDSEMSCAIYISDETPYINLSQEIISGLARLNATVDIDIVLTE